MRDGSKELPRVHPKRNKPIIGLAGGIGAGKTSVAGVFESLGAAVIDFDGLCHEQLDDPEVITTLRRWWGDFICAANRGIDRQAVASIVFDDAEQLGRLEGLLYPRVGQRREKLTEAYNADPKVRAIVLDAAKLYEAGLHELCDVVVFVDADRSVRLRRVAADRGWTSAELTRRENLQKPLDIKKENADHVVINHSGIDDLRSQIEPVFSSVLASFS